MPIIPQILAEPKSLEKLLALRHAVEMEGQRIVALRNAALTENQARMLAEALSSRQQPAHLDIVHVPGVSAPLAWRISNQAMMAATKKTAEPLPASALPVKEANYNSAPCAREATRGYSRSLPPKNLFKSTLTLVCFAPHTEYTGDCPYAE